MVSFVGEAACFVPATGQPTPGSSPRWRLQADGELVPGQIQQVAVRKFDRLVRLQLLAVDEICQVAAWPDAHVINCGPNGSAPIGRGRSRGGLANAYECPRPMIVVRDPVGRDLSAGASEPRG